MGHCDLNVGDFLPKLPGHTSFRSPVIMKLFRWVVEGDEQPNRAMLLRKKLSNFMQRLLLISYIKDLIGFKINRWAFGAPGRDSLIQTDKANDLAYCSGILSCFSLS